MISRLAQALRNPLAFATQHRRRGIPLSPLSKLTGLSLRALGALAAAVAVPSFAQSPGALPVHEELYKNVDVSTGSLTYQTYALSVGSGAYPERFDVSARGSDFFTTRGENYLDFAECLDCDPQDFQAGGHLIRIMSRGRTLNFSYGSNIEGAGYTLDTERMNYSLSKLTLTAPDGEITIFEMVEKSSCQMIMAPVSFSLCNYASYRQAPNGAFVKFLFEPMGSFYNTARLKAIVNSAGFRFDFSYAGPATLAAISASRPSCVSSATVNCGLGSFDTASFSIADGVRTVTYGGVTYKYTHQSYNSTYPTDVSMYGPVSQLQVGPSGSLLNIFTTSVQSNVPTSGDGYKTERSLTDAGGRTWEFDTEYDVDNILTMARVTGPDGGVTTYTYGADGPRANGVANHYTNTSAYDYDGSGHLLSETAPEGNSIAYTYDSRGNVLTTTRVAKGGAISFQETWTYPACTSTNRKICNKPTSYTDARSAVTEFLYDDAHGGLVGVLAPADAQGNRRLTVHEYDFFYPASGTVPTAAEVAGAPSPVIWLHTATLRCTSHASAVAATCPGGSIKTSFVYVPSTLNARSGHELAQVIDDATGVASATSFTYDAVGNVISVDGPRADGDVLTMTYDSGRRLLTKASPDPDGSGPKPAPLLTNYYDVYGRLYRTEQALAGGPASTYITYANALDVANVTDPAGAVANYTYDAAGRPRDTLQTVEGVVRKTRNVYDFAGRLIEVRSAVGLTTGSAVEQVTAAYSYSANGTRLSETDASGNRTTVCYDGFDRVAELRYPSRTADAPALAQLCSDVGIGGSLASGATRETYTYDGNDNLTAVVKRDGQVVALSYDALNRVVLKDVPTADRDVTYGYDLLSRQTSASLPGTNAALSASWTYDGLGRRTSATIGSRTIGYTYAADSSWIRLSLPGGLTIQRNLDPLGRETSIQEVGGLTLAAYDYDQLSRRTLTNFTGNGTSTSYGYSSYELSGLSHDLAGTSRDVLWGFTYNAAGELKTRTRDNDAYAWPNHYNVTRPYTSNGLNQYKTSGPRQLGYDLSGNLVSDQAWTYAYDVENRLVGVNGPKQGVLTYDALGRLARVTVDGQTTEYQYDSLALVAEYDGSGTLIRRHVHGPGTDEPIVTYEGSSRQWLYADAQGSVAAVADASGNSLAANSYGPYGESGVTHQGRFGFTGQARLPELGLYYYKARIYSPLLGRFLQPDPIGTAGGMNIYAYADNDPINVRDPFGLAGCAFPPGPSINVCGPSRAEREAKERRERDSEAYRRLPNDRDIYSIRDVVNRDPVVLEAAVDNPLAGSLNPLAVQYGQLTADYENGLITDQQFFDIDRQQGIATLETVGMVLGSSFIGRSVAIQGAGKGLAKHGVGRIGQIRVGGGRLIIRLDKGRPGQALHLNIESHTAGFNYHIPLNPLRWFKK